MKKDLQVTSLASNTLPRVYLGLVLVFIAVVTWRPLGGGEDFWSHIAVGRWIAQHHDVPRQTLFVWGASPQSWIAHSWLSELVLYGVMQVGGPRLVLLLTIVFVALPFFWFWKLWESNARIKAGAPVFFDCAIWSASIRFQPRPELFSAFFTALLLLFLIDQRRRNDSPFSWRGVAVVVMFALWANFHGGVALGLLLVGATAFIELLQRGWKRAAPLLAIAVLCFVAVNINPYGFDYWKVLLQVGSPMFKMIDEWKPPYLAPALPFSGILLVVLLPLLSAMVWWRNPKRQWAQALWLFLGIVLFLMARRNLWPCMTIAVAVAAANAEFFPSIRLPKLDLRQAELASHGAAMCVLISAILIFVSPQILALRATSTALPKGVADYVLNKEPPGPIFNDYLHSGFFEWRFGEKRKLYIDLQNAYPPQLLSDYFAIIKRSDEGKQKWESLRVNTVIVGPYRKSSRLAPLAGYLDGSTQWAKEYSGPGGSVWVRKKALR